MKILKNGYVDHTKKEREFLDKTHAALAQMLGMEPTNRSDEDNKDKRIKNGKRL